MKVFIVGGTGRVGSEVAKLLIEQGHSVTIGCRNPQDRSFPEAIKAVNFDLHWELGEIKMAINGSDAIYFTAGSRGKDLLQVDAFGAVKLMRAAERIEAHRFIMLSSIFSLQPEKWTTEPSLASIINYDIAKFFADRWLVDNTKLNWTIVQPSVLTEAPTTGCIELNPEHDGSNPIPDVAQVLAEALDRKNTWHKVIMMRSGNTPINEALEAL